MVSMSSSSSSLSVSRSGMDRLLMILTCGWPCVISSKGSHCSRGVAVCCWWLKLWSGHLCFHHLNLCYLFVMVTEHEVSDDELVVGDEGSKGIAFWFKERR